MKKVTLLDIAHKLNISQGLVSLALSGSDLVNEQTRAEIIVTAFEMGYDINKRKIGKQRRDVFSIVCSDLSYFNTFFWTEIIKGAENYLNEHNIGIDLVVYKYNQEDEFLINTINKQTKGLIVLANCDRKIHASLSKADLPMVIIDGTNYYGLECDLVEASNYYSAYGAARYLVSKGHTHIGFIGAWSVSMSFKMRRDGFQAGSKFYDKQIEYSEVIDEAVGVNITTFNEEKVKKLLKSKNRPTALMCANDITALGVHNIMDSLGLKCPEDVSLVGFDNIYYPDKFINNLTTFDLQKQKMGETAARILKERIENPQRPLQVVEIIATMIERSSVKEIK